MNLRDRTLICQWQDYITRLHKFFIQKTGSKAILVDFYAAIHNEILYIKRQYPGVRDKKIIDRAYDRIVEAYERNEEFPVYLNWRSIASFMAQERSGLTWAVLQARADRSSGEKPKLKDNEIPFMIKKKRIAQMGWCPFCFMTARIIRGRYECCGVEVKLI